MDYQRHQPETSVVYQVVRDHLAEFLQAAKDHDGKGLPPFIEKAFRAFLRCGRLEFGFARIGCLCGHWAVVAFSCKGRGICGSCMGRMMEEGAFHLVDHVFPSVPIRQWVVGFPFGVSQALAFRPAVLSDVERMAEREILRFLGQRSGGKSGGLIVNHRFGSALNIAPHLHLLLLDGGYEDSEAPAFHAAPPLRQEELQALATRMAHGLVRILKRHKLLADDGATAQLELDALGACTTQAMQHGTREKQGPALSLVQEDEVETPRGKLVANIDGFNLYAGPVIDGRDRETLQRTARYLLRAPFALGRFGKRPDGLITYRMKKADRRGNTVLVMTPMQLMSRLASLIPIPRRQTHRLFGVLGSAARLRSRIVPSPTHRKPEKKVHEHHHDAVPLRAYKQPIAWAQLLERTFGLDPMVCPKCGQRMRVIAVLEEKAEIQRYLAHAGLAEDPRVCGPPTLAA